MDPSEPGTLYQLPGTASHPRLPQIHSGQESPHKEQHDWHVLHPEAEGHLLPSPPALSLEIWHWAIYNNINLLAEHFLGMENDFESAQQDASTSP